MCRYCDKPVCGSCTENDERFTTWTCLYCHRDDVTIALESVNQRIAEVVAKDPYEIAYRNYIKTHHPRVGEWVVIHDWKVRVYPDYLSAMRDKPATSERYFCREVRKE